MGLAGYGESDRLARAANAMDGGLPAGWPRGFALTDPDRTPDLANFAQGLPRGCGLVYRHFGQPEALISAALLSAISEMRSLFFLVSGDEELARQVSARGVHWPNARLPDRLDDGLVHTASVHSPAELRRAERAGVDAVFISPVFATRSTGSGPALGLFRAQALAGSTHLPAYALGGINSATAKRLTGSAFSGLAAIEGWMG